MPKTQKRRFTNCDYLTDARPGDLGVVKVCHMLQVGLRTATGFKVLFVLSKDRGVDIVVKPRVAPLMAIGSSLLVMVLVMLATGEGVTWNWLWFPLIFVLATMFAFGGSLITARLTESVRDTRNLLPFVFRLLFYISGILYDVTRFTDEFTRTRPELGFIDHLFLLNPFYVYVSLAREALMPSYEHNNPPLLWLAGTLWAVVAMVGGLWYFVGAEKQYGRG